MRGFLRIGPGCLGVLLAAGAASAATVTVNPGDSIQTAINSASAGDTILIRPGVYIQTFTATKQLTFKGTPGKSILDGAGEAANICTISGGVAGCVFTGLTFRFADYGYAGIYGFPGVDGTAISKCTFLGNPDRCVDLHGSDLSVQKCVFRSNGAGVTLDGGNGRMLAGNRHSACLDTCEVMYGSGTMTKSTADLVQDDGAFYVGGTITATGLKVTRCFAGVESGGDPSGVRLSALSGDLVYGDFVDIDGTDHTIEKCKASHVGGTAFSIGAGNLSDSGLITGCSATFVGTGAEFFGSGGEISGNRISMCTTGLYLGFSNSGGLASGNTIRDCFEAGIEVLSHPNATVRGNSIARVRGESDFESAAIMVDDSDGTILDANTIGDVDAGSGIAVTDSNGVQITGNTIDGTASSGIILAGYRYYVGFYYSGECFCNVYTYDEYPASGGTIRGNRVSGTGFLYGAGILCYMATSTTVEANQVSGAGGRGIQLQSCGGVTVLQNSIDGTGTDGIIVFSNNGTGNNVIDGNTVRDAGAEGIENDATPQGTGTVIRNNTVTDSALAPFANSGEVNVGLSTGNAPATNWATVPVPRQRF